MEQVLGLIKLKPVCRPGLVPCLPCCAANPASSQCGIMSGGWHLPVDQWHGRSPQRVCRRSPGARTPTRGTAADTSVWKKTPHLNKFNYLPQKHLTSNTSFPNCPVSLHRTISFGSVLAITKPHADFDFIRIRNEIHFFKTLILLFACSYFA